MTETETSYKQKLVNAEIKRLTKIFKKSEASESKIKAAKELILNISFMSVELSFLREAISKNGVIEEYKNGENQWGRKKSAEIDVYNTTLKNFATLNKQLLYLFDAKTKTDKEKDELFNFIKSKPD